MRLNASADKIGPLGSASGPLSLGASLQGCHALLGFFSADGGFAGGGAGAGGAMSAGAAWLK